MARGVSLATGLHESTGSREGDQAPAARDAGSQAAASPVTAAPFTRGAAVTRRRSPLGGPDRGTTGPAA